MGGGTGARCCKKMRQMVLDGAGEASVPFFFKAKIEPDGDVYHGYCPELPGLHVGGTEEEVYEALTDAVYAYMGSVLAGLKDFTIQEMIQTIREGG